MNGPMEQTALPEQYLNLKTRRTYESSWRRFVAFCVAVGRPALPFLTKLAAQLLHDPAHVAGQR